MTADHPHTTADNAPALRIFRRVGLGLLTAAAVTMFFALAPAPQEPHSAVLSTNYRRLVDAAMADYDANDRRADSAPKQQVVNGWVARDLLQIQTLQLADILTALTEEAESGALVVATDHRVPALLVVGIAAIALIGVTSEPVPRLGLTTAQTSAANRSGNETG